MPILIIAIIGLAFLALPKVADMLPLPLPSPDDDDDDNGGGGGSAYVPTNAERANTRQLIIGYAHQLGNMMGLNPSQLANYLQQQARSESRFNRFAVNSQDKGKPNAARGVFQIRPKSAFPKGTFGDLAAKNPQCLFDVRVQMVAILRYIHSLRNYSGEGSISDIDWLAIDRGMAYPFLTGDRDESHDRSPVIRQRMTKSLNAMGIGLGLMDKKVFGAGYHYPGTKQLLAAVGLTVADLYNLKPQRPSANA